MPIGTFSPTQILLLVLALGDLGTRVNLTYKLNLLSGRNSTLMLLMIYSLTEYTIVGDKINMTIKK